jgi:hypothetical protein
MQHSFYQGRGQDVTVLLLLLLFPSMHRCYTDAPTVGTFNAGQGGRVDATRCGTVFIKEGDMMPLLLLILFMLCCRTDAPTVGTFTAGQGGRVNATRGGTVLIKDGVRVVDARGNFSASTNAPTFNVLGKLTGYSGALDITVL